MSSKTPDVPSIETEPEPGQWLEPRDFECVVRLTPLVSMDLLVRAPDGRVLVGRRLNEPAKSTFFLGVYDHFYPTNRFEKPGFGTHYVVLGYELPFFRETSALPKEQHGEYCWKSEAGLIASPEVHENTKAYFRESGGTRLAHSR